MTSHSSPPDVLIGKELANLLKNTAGLPGTIADYMFVYDPFLDSEDMPAKPTFRISPATQGRTRQARQIWSKGCSVYGVLITEANADYDPDWIDRWLFSYDQVLDTIEELLPLGNPTVSVEQDDRYDFDILHTDSRLVMTCEISYNIIGT